MGQHYGPTTVRDGLIQLLDAANPKSYPGTGTVWKDLSASGNDATLLNGTSFNNGKLVFDGVDDSASINIPSEVNNRSASFELWFRIAIDSADQDLLNIGQHSTNTPFLLWYDRTVGLGMQQGNQKAISFAATGATMKTISTPSNSIAPNEYYHLVAVIDVANAVQKIFLNGELKVSETWQELGITVGGYTTMSIGSATDYSRPLNGELNTLNIYNRALSEEEVKQNFEATRGRYGL